MLYRFVKILMRAALGLFYKEILQRNLHQVPEKGPALLVANHPSSLMDAALLGILVKRPIHFFARGDIFINRFVKRILYALHMYPVFNHQDGRHTLGANDDAFDKAIDLLQQGQVVLFFPEGISHTDYRLLNFRKGAFRIALKAVHKNPSIQLPIVPIGINYSHPTKPFSRAWVIAGPPILANDWLHIYSTQPSLALKQLTSASFIALKQLVLDANNDSPGTLFQLLETWRNARQWSNAKPGDYITSELRISQSLHSLPTVLIEKLSAYEADLKAASVEDASIAAVKEKKLSVLPLVFGFPAALIGWVLNGFPLLLARKIADMRVKRIDFYSWILVTSAAFLYLTWFVLVALLAFMSLPAWKAIALLFIIISTGQYSWNYFDYFLQWKTQRVGIKLEATNRGSLMKQQQLILESITSLS